MMEREAEAGSERAAGDRRFLKYTFFKTAREWRALERKTKDSCGRELIELLQKRSSVRLSYFSLVGLRGDADFMILADSASLDSVQGLISGILSTAMGRYLDTPFSYLAMTRPSHYIGSHRHPGQEGTIQDSFSNSKFLFLYPFVKKREWYRLAFEERRRIMAEHFKIGHRYPKIKIHTGYSFGLDDQEFVLAFEGDEPSEFLDLVEELRSSEASMYTQLETPIFTCRRVDPPTMLSLLG